MKLPPVRRAVPLRRGDGRPGSTLLKRCTDPYTVSFYGSGTEALAAALAHARASQNRMAPEAILPAYGCPDLVAACVFAGVRPRLVDTKVHSWGFDESKLEAAITDNTVAIVAVNLLGVGDQAGYLSGLARRHDIRLIQDSAQYLPDRSIPAWRGDFVVFSFGRGKPLNLLRGGALLSRAEPAMPAPFPLTPGGSGSLRESVLASRCAAFAFNVLTHPRWYWLTSRLPGLGLGNTVYKPLQSVRSPALLKQQLESAYYRYSQTDNYSADQWQQSLRAWQTLGITLLRCEDEPKIDAQYLRLPLLASSQQQRDRLVDGLNQAGLGASPMYRTALNRVPGIPASVAQQGPFEGAENLAARLLTIPSYIAAEAGLIARFDAVFRSL